MNTMRRLPRRARGSAFALAVLLGGAVAILTACGVQPAESAAPEPTPWVVAPLTTPLPTPAEEATPTPSEWPEWRDWVITVRNDNAQPVRLVVAIDRGSPGQAVGTVVPEAVQPGEWLDVVLSLPRPLTMPRGSWGLFIYLGDERYSGTWTVQRYDPDLDPTELYVAADGQIGMGPWAAQLGDRPPWEWPEDMLRPPDRG